MRLDVEPLKETSGDSSPLLHQVRLQVNMKEPKPAHGRALGEAFEALLRSRSGELCASSGPRFFICKMAPPLVYTCIGHRRDQMGSRDALCVIQQAGGGQGRPDLPSP